MSNYSNNDLVTLKRDSDPWLATHYINPNPSPSEIAEHNAWIANHNRIVANNLKNPNQIHFNNNSNDQWLATHYINPKPSPTEIANHRAWIADHNRMVANNLRNNPNQNQPNPSPNDLNYKNNQYADYNSYN